MDSTTTRARVVSPNGAPTEISDGRRRVALDVRPDFDMASRWARTLKFVHHIELRRNGRWKAAIHGNGHHAPVTNPISVPTAVALALRGTPLVLTIDEGTEQR